MSEPKTLEAGGHTWTLRGNMPPQFLFLASELQGVDVPQVQMLAMSGGLMSIMVTHVDGTPVPARPMPRRQEDLQAAGRDFLFDLGDAGVGVEEIGDLVPALLQEVMRSDPQPAQTATS